MATTSTSKQTHAGLILAAWLVVGVPLAWGVVETCKNAAKLFHAPPPATAPAATPAK